MTAAAAILVGLRLGAIDLLGAGSAELRARILPTLDEAGVRAAADWLRRTAFGRWLGPQTEEELTTALLAAKGDILALIDENLVRDQSAAQLGPGFPFELYSHGSATSQLFLDIELADAHLHSGASISLADFCEILVGSSRSIGDSALTMVTADVNGVSYKLGVVVAGLRVLLQWYAVRNRPELIFPQERCAAAISDGTFWSEIRAAALGQPSAEFWSELKTAVDVGAVGEVVRVQIPLIVAAARDTGTAAERRTAAGLVAATVLLNDFLRSQPAEGLARFVDRFGAMGIMRDEMLLATRPELVEKACLRCLPNTNVVAAEFRKTMVPGPTVPVSKILRKIGTDLTAHLAGFASFMRLSSVDRSLTMPIGWLRERSTRVSDNDELRYVHDVSKVWVLARAYSGFCSEHPDLARYVQAIDVAGDETAMPNWPFLAAFDWLQSLPHMSDLSVSIHAGEAFRWRLRGLRSVGELVLPSPTVDRIGHALALDRDISALIVNRPVRSITARDVMDDLVWLLRAGIQVPAAADFLDRVTAKVHLDELEFSAEDWIEGATLRASLAGWSSLGLIQGDPASSVSGPIALQGTSWAESRTPAHMASLLQILRGPGVWSYLDEDVGAELAVSYFEWSNSIADEVSELVRAAIVGAPVTLEACPTSNLRLTGAGLYRYLPIKKWIIEDGLTVTLNSDDPLIFGSSIVDEANIVAAEFGSEICVAMASDSVRLCSQGRPRGSHESYEHDLELARRSFE